MKSLLLLISLSATILMAYAAEEFPTYLTVKSVVEGAISAIEAKDIDKLLNEFVSPQDLKKLKEKDADYQELKKTFMASEKAGALVFQLKLLKDITPTYSKEKDTLEFKDDKKFCSIKFSQENGKWYIKN